MTLHRTTLDQWAAAHEQVLRIVLSLTALVVLVIVASALFGVHIVAPSLQFVPDPAGVLPF